MWKTSWLLLACGVTAARAQRPGPCKFDVGTPLQAAIDPRALAGGFDLVWYPASARFAAASRPHRLWLWRTLPTDSSSTRAGVRPGPEDTLTYPLYGATALPNDKHVSSDVLRRTTDPIFPPVLLLVTRPPDDPHAQWPTLLLLLDGVRNREPAPIAIEGIGIGVRLDHAGPLGFAGRYGPWMAAEGFSPVDSGYVCARRLR